MLRLKRKIINWRTLTLICFFGLFFISLLLTEKFSQSFHFVDEDDHLVFAHFMNKGYKLYSDLSTNHQPLPYFLSSLTQKITKPNTLFFLVRRGREAVFLFSFIWSLFLLSQYGLFYLIFIIFFETTKFFLFGNLLLAESLAVYPLLFVVGETFKVLFYSHQPRRWQSFVFGLANFFIIFNLLPLVPSLLFISLIYILKTKRLKQFLLGLILPTAVLFIFISPFDWLRETVYYNLKYVGPALSVIKNKSEIFKFFIFPFLFLFDQKTSLFGQFIQLFSFLLILSFAWLLFFSKKRKILSWLFFLLLVLFLNNRVLNPEEIYYYNGFHLLPWYASFIFFILLTIQLLVKKVKGIKRFIPLLVLAGGGICLFLNPQMPYLTKINKDYEHNVNFYPYFLVGKGISSVSQPEDRLSVLPDESLIYWQSGLKPATRQIVYYEWEYWVPDLKEQMDGVFTNNPPEFIYADFKRIGQASYLPILNSTLEKDYWQITREGVAQNLYIKKERIGEVTEEQWGDWVKLGFDKIEI